MSNNFILFYLLYQIHFVIQQPIKPKTMMENVDLYAEKFNEQLLDKVYKHFNSALSNPEPLCSQDEIINQKFINQRQRVIKMDCLRTRSTIFDQPLKDQLQLMLTHYCQFFDINYKQGLNQLAAPFIYFRKVGVPISKCEALFHKFFHTYGLNFYDDDNFSSVQLFVKMFSVVLKYHDPALSRYLDWHSIEPQIFCINWLMTLFSSKLSMALVYLLWSFMAAEKDKFFLFFLVLSIVEINRQNIIESKNVNVLQVVTNLIFKQQSTLRSVVERALLLRKNTPSSLILFFRDRMIFEKRQKFNDVALLLEHMSNLNLFMILPGQMTLDKHLSKGLCEKDCYFCDLRKPLQIPAEPFNQSLSKFINTSNDIRNMNFTKQYVIVDVRIDQTKQVSHNGIIFKVTHKENIQDIEDRFLSKFIQEKGRKHFVFVLTNFTFQDLNTVNNEELEMCKKIISVLNSLSFPLIGILQGGFQAFVNYDGDLTESKVQKNQSIICEDLLLCSYELPYSFPLKISDRCRLANAFCGDQVTTFIGLVQILLILDYFIFIIPIQKELISFINYFQHNHSVMQYLYQYTHKPAELLVHRVISMRSLKKASMKAHNQNILALLYDSCEHQQKRIFTKISKYLQMDVSSFVKLGQICQQCQKKKNKIVIQMSNAGKVKECAQVLTTRYMQMRKRVKAFEQI